MKIQVKVTDKHIKRGIPQCIDQCPIALALTDLGYDVISVGLDTTLFYDKNRVNVFSFFLPPIATDFIKRFDNLEHLTSFDFTLEEEY
jgi:hypothetical protein